MVQAATKLVLEPIFEVDFQDCPYGFWPGRSATQALEVLRVRGARAVATTFTTPTSPTSSAASIEAC